MRLIVIKVLSAILVSTMLSQAADPAPKPSPFPILPTTPTVELPKADPDAVPVLGEDMVYIVKDDAEFILRASPRGLVEITRTSTPFVFAKFVGGDSSYKGVQFKEKNVAIVTAKKGAKGRVELIYSPKAAPDDTTDMIRMIDVNGPRPPPPVVEPPKVDPKIEPPKAKGEFRVMFVWDRLANIPDGQLNALNSTKVADYLDANCAKDSDGRPGWRSWGLDVTFSDKTLKWWKDAWMSVKPNLGKLPQVVIFIGTEGQVHPLPDTEEKTLQFLKDQKAQAEGK